MKTIVLYDERQDITLAAKAYPTADSWLADVDGRIFRIYDQAYVRWFRCYIREVVGIAQNVVMLGVEPVKGSGEIEYFKLGDINLVFDPFDQDSVEIDASAIGINNQTATTQQQVMSSGDIKRMMAGGTGIPASVFAPSTPQKTTVSATAVKSDSTTNVDDIDYDHPSEQYRNIDDDFDTIDVPSDDDGIDASHLGIDAQPTVEAQQDIKPADVDNATNQQSNAASKKSKDAPVTDSDDVDKKIDKQQSSEDADKSTEQQTSFHASDTVKHDTDDDIPSDLFADLENVPDAETQETIDELRHMMYGDEEESFIFRDIELPDENDDNMFYDLITGEKQKFHKVPPKTAGKKKASKKKQKQESDGSGNITAKMSDDVRRNMETHLAEQQNVNNIEENPQHDSSDDKHANADDDAKQQHGDNDMQTAGTARDITMHDETYAVVMDDIDDDDTDDDVTADDVRDDVDVSDISEENVSDEKKDDTVASDDADSAANKKEAVKRTGKCTSRKKENAKVSKSGVGKKSSNKKKGSDKGGVSDSDGASAPSDDMKDAVSGDDAKGSCMGDEKPKRQLLSIDGMFDDLIEDDGYGSDVELDLDEFELGDEAVSRINEMRDAAMRKAEEERQKVAEREAEQQGEQSMEDTLRHIASELDIEIPDGVDAKMIVSVLDEMMMRRTAQDDVDAANDADAVDGGDVEEPNDATSGEKPAKGTRRGKNSKKKRDERAERAVIAENATTGDDNDDKKQDDGKHTDADEIADAYMSMFDEQPTSDAMSVIEKFLKRYDDTVREQEMRSKQMHGKAVSSGDDDIDDVMADIEADIKASEESVKKRKSSKRKRPTSKKYVKTLHIDEESDGDDLMVETNVAAD